MKKIIIFLLLVFSPLWAQTTPTQALEALFKPFESVTSVQADFVQENFLAMLTGPVQSKGFFVFQNNPAALRFMYNEPFENGLLFTNGNVWRIIKKEKTPIQGAMAQTVAAQLMVWLTMDREKLLQNYNVTPFEEGLVFKPKTPQALAQITVWFHDTLPGALKEVELKEAGGDKTVLHFSNVRLNENLNRSVFQ